MDWAGGAAGTPDPRLIETDLESRAVFGSWSGKRAGSTRDVGAALELLEALGGSQRIPTVLVTGSKGKGQAAAVAAAYLSAAGFRTGLVSSPGTVSNLDRFALDGTVIGAAEYNRWLHRVEPAVSEVDVSPGNYLAPTGIFTIMGHAMLEAAGAEVIVHEAGMGGAHDEISVLDRIAVGFTSVFPEHLDVFGPTLAHVAREKFGLIRDGDRVFSVPQSPVPSEILRRTCDRMDASVHQVPPGDFLSQNHHLGKSLADDVARRLDREPWTGGIELCRPGRAEFCRTAEGTEFFLDACIDPVGMAAALSGAESRWGVVDTVYWSIPATKDISGIADFLDGRGIDHRFVPLDSHHLDYELPTDLLQRLRFAPREMLLDDMGDRSVVAGTVSFGSSVLNEIGVMPTRLYDPDRIGSGEIPHI